MKKTIIFQKTLHFDRNVSYHKKYLHISWHRRTLSFVLTGSWGRIFWILISIFVTAEFFGNTAIWLGWIFWKIKVIAIIILSSDYVRQLFWLFKVFE